MHGDDKRPHNTTVARTTTWKCELSRVNSLHHFYFNISIETQIWRLRAELPWSWLRGWRQSRRTEKHVINWTLLALYIYQNTNTHTHTCYKRRCLQNYSKYFWELWRCITNLYQEQRCTRNSSASLRLLDAVSGGVCGIDRSVSGTFWTTRNTTTSLLCAVGDFVCCKTAREMLPVYLSRLSRPHGDRISSYFHAKPTRTRTLMRSAQEDSGYVARISQWTCTLRPSTIT